MKGKLSKYTIGDACKILNITQGGIRFYERKGIITSKREDQNKYRYYSFRDLNTIMTIREYRSLGFSLEEAGNLVKKESIDEVEDKFQNQILKMEEEIKEAQLRLNNIREKQEQIRNVKKYLNKHIIKNRQPLYRLSCQEGERVINDSKLITIIEKWHECEQVVKYCPCIPKDKITKGVAAEVGFAILEEDSPFKIEEEKYVKYYKDQKCVYTVIEVTDGDVFIDSFYELIKESIEYIEKNNMKIVNDILGYKIATLKNNGQKDYYEIFFPIE